MPTKKRPTRKLKTGRRTVRTAGMSQSAFAGYGHQAPAQPPAPPEVPEDQEDKEGNEDKEDNREEDTKDRASDAP